MLHKSLNAHKMRLIAADGSDCFPAAGTLTQLSWSSNSELLAVVLSEAPADNSKGHKDIVQIWHRSNWHWYLKQEQVYPGGWGVRVCWDEVIPLRLHICSGLTWYRQVSLCMASTSHPAANPTSFSLACRVSFFHESRHLLPFC